jgi:hypothetical protein
MYAPIQPPKRLIQDGSVDSTVSGVATSTGMDSRTQPIFGLLIRQALRMLSPTIHRSGTIPMTMDSATTRNILMGKRGGIRTDQTVAEQRRANPLSTVGAALTKTVMDGLTPLQPGWQVQGAQAMPGHKIRHNGTTPMAMDAEITREEPPQTFAPQWRGLPLGLPPVVTVGGARTRMATVGPTLGMPSSTNPRSGEIQTAMVTVTDWPAIKAMPVLKHAGPPFSTASDAGTQMGTVGPTPPRLGPLIHSVRETPSPLRRFNGKTPTKMDSATCLWVRSETIVLNSRVRPNGTSKVARMETEMVGLIPTVGSLPPSPSWVKTLQLLGSPTA